MILKICDNGDLLNILRIIRIIIIIIKIVVPIILIVTGMLDFASAAKEGETSKVFSIFTKRVIASLLIFFIPTFVGLIADAVSYDSDNYLSCISNATEEGVKQAYTNNSRQLINIAKKTLNYSDYQIALTSINKLSDANEKNQLLNELNKIKRYIELKQEILELNKNYDSDKYAKIYSEIQKITDADVKKTLTKLLKTQSETGPKLNVESSFKKYNDSTYPIFSGYYLYIPKNATENMPLIVVFPPNSLSGPSMKNIVESKSLDNLKAFIYIPLIAGSERRDWNTSASANAVKKINDLVKEYKINEKKISLTAFSSSGYYIYWTANEYRIFSAIAPISSGMNIEKIKNYKDWTYLKTLPMKGYGEKGGPTTASGRSCANKTVGWSAKTAMCGVFEGLGKCSSCTSCDAFTYLPEVCHGEIGSYVFSIDDNKNGISDIMEWMISQTK